MAQPNQYPPIPLDDPKRQLIISNANTEKSLPLVGLVCDTYTITLSGEDTNDRFCLIYMHIPPGGGPPPHRHDIEETFIPLEGEVEATFREKKSTARTGKTVKIPANAPHQFHMRPTKPARLLCIRSPAGQEKFFQEVDIAVATRTTAPPEPNEKQQKSSWRRRRHLRRSTVRNS